MNMLGAIIVLGILLFVGLLIVCVGDALLQWLIDECPLLGGLVCCILFVVALWGVIELFTMDW